jgi:hypothetical protein
LKIDLGGQIGANCTLEKWARSRSQSAGDRRLAEPPDITRVTTWRERHRSANNRTR